jgi:hypothetical protein
MAEIKFEKNYTNGELIIVELNPPFDRLYFQFVPEEFDVPREASLDSLAVIGRNNNLYQYTGGFETLNLPFEFYASDEKRGEVLKAVNWLKSLTMSNSDSGIPRVKIVFGDMFLKETWIVQSVLPKFSSFDSNYSWLPGKAKVDVKLLLDTEIDMKQSDRR